MCLEEGGMGDDVVMDSLDKEGLVKGGEELDSDSERVKRCVSQVLQCLQKLLLRTGECLFPLV